MSECPACQRTFETEVGMLSHNGLKHQPPIDGWCQFPDCPNRAKAHKNVYGIKVYRRLCSMHQKRRESEAARKAGRTCSVNGCGKPTSQSLQFCAMHASRLQRLGDVRAEVPPYAMLRCPSEICAAQNCDHLRFKFNGTNSQGSSRYCSAHRWRSKTYGSTFPDIPVPAKKGALKAAAEAMSQK